MRERDEWEQRDHRSDVRTGIAAAVLTVLGFGGAAIYDIHEHGPLTEHVVDGVTGTASNLKSGIHELGVLVHRHTPAN